MSERSLWGFLVLSLAFCLLVGWYLSEQAIKCHHRGGIYIRTLWSFECVKEERK